MLTINKLKKVSYPKEHGSWGFFIEPILLSLIVAYTYTGLLLAISAFIIFLAHQPVRVLLNNHDKELKKTAFIILVLYFVLTSSLLAEIFSQVQFEMLLLFFAAILMMFFFLILEFFKLGRHLIIEFIAPVAITLIGLNIAVFDAWDNVSLFAFEIILLSRVIPTVFYVNAKVQIIRKTKSSFLPLRISEFAFLILIIFLAFYAYVPALSIVAIIFLIARSFIGLFPKNQNEKVKQLGIKEFAYGFLFIIINSFGYLFGL